ncbi:trimeric intracellular cation channel family protein [Gorillibacterium massiliense]|uniref:trimeric intracellular cation channel family protein n=1 Tax=Gorillibacterium massiliense TaxID=1280390 RepID=UPI0004B7ADC8|nr:trimeric intracellular cation channel family protein [Gorillibacterium massiliense]
MNWELFSLIGTIAFAVSGAIVAMEEEYDILGVYVLGLATAFGGGIIRNLLIGIPVTTLWEQGILIKTAIAVITLVFVIPHRWIERWKIWETLFDAIGLAAFAIQGALFATKQGVPVSAVIVAAMMTGIGGGIIRDMLANRKPLVLRDEIYAVWAMIGGVFVGLKLAVTPTQLAILFVSVILLRMISVRFKWKLPKRTLSRPEWPESGFSWKTIKWK